MRGSAAKPSVLSAQLTEQLAVYGTLKRGFCNAHWLSGARFVGEDRLPAIRLHDLGPYPGAVALPSRGVPVEVYALTVAHLRRIDELEDYDAAQPSRGLYDRRPFRTRFGTAWVYLYNGEISQYPVIATWR